ncbi:hypothetical protein EJ04DRAFT_570021 [Polyplosphaeria fusca]|uniref:1,3-beta-glucanosyltransferase n=1 Tax=Polyplosphaeria fusca TaxID=682080 RepID=A0A9P4UTI4_9PLEO|nr:hypothetical protein EJ04DRAFT_570021 [Polyplosphaeria fusca]
MTINGIWYSRSNSTTDANAMDPLTDPEACTRDAALMSDMGINTIYVMAIDPKENHDDCFSIFNSVGIYVLMMLRKDAVFPTSYDDFAGSYNTDFLKSMFEIVDAVKDYDNLMGFDLGNFPAISQFALSNRDLSYPDAEKMYRAFVRDTKEYIAKNAPRPILVGWTLYLPRNDELLDASDLASDHVYWLGCAVDGDQDDLSRADYVSFWNLGFFETSPVKDQVEGYKSLADKLEFKNVVPVWLQMYGVSDEADYVEYELRPDLVEDSLLLYNSSSQIVQPNGPLSGGARFTWTNANLGWKVPKSNWGLVITQENGNVQQTEMFDRLRSVFKNMNTENWLSGDSVSSGEGHPACKKDDMVNTTTEFFFDQQTTMTIATDWELPTRPAGLDALITSGVGGQRGQMVDVTITAIVHTVRDFKGNVVTDLSLKPSKSESRTTTRSTSSGTAPPVQSSDTPLSTGAKAGIGVGAGVGGLAIAGLAAFFLLRHRRNAKAAAAGKDTQALDQESTEGGGYHKAELATGPGVELQQAELPGATHMSPQEVPAREQKGYIYAMNGDDPAELPTTERTVELPGR